MNEASKIMFPHISIFCLIMLIVLNGCGNESISQNSSTKSSIALNTLLPVMTYAALDKTGNYVNVITKDQLSDNTRFDRINIKSLGVEETFSYPFTIWREGNVLIDDENKLSVVFATESRQRFFINRFGLNYKTEFSDTLIYGVDPDYSVNAIICHTADGQIATASNLYNSSGRAVLSFCKRDNDYNILSQTFDNSIANSSSDVIYGGQFYQTSDGSYIYCAQLRKPPSYDLDVIYEKRDKDFNLIWRKYIDGLGDQVSDFSTVLDGQLYSYVQNKDPLNGFKNNISLVVYNADGEIVKTKELNNGKFDQVVNQDFVRTDNGDFLFCIKTADSNNSANVLLVVNHTDAEFNTIEQVTYGGSNSVSNSRLVKIESNKYLLLYNDNGFKADQNKYRLVYQYIDATGKPLK